MRTLKTLNIQRLQKTKTMSHQRIWAVMKNLVKIGQIWKEKLLKKIVKRNDIKEMIRMLIVQSTKVVTRAVAAGKIRKTKI